MTDADYERIGRDWAEKRGIVVSIGVSGSTMYEIKNLPIVMQMVFGIEHHLFASEALAYISIGACIHSLREFVA